MDTLGKKDSKVSVTGLAKTEESSNKKTFPIIAAYKTNNPNIVNMINCRCLTL